jgi:hypothetical protein
MLALDRDDNIASLLNNIDLSMHVKTFRTEIDLPVPPAPPALAMVEGPAVGKVDVQPLCLEEHQVIETTGAVEILVEV